MRGLHVTGCLAIGMLLAGVSLASAAAPKEEALVDRVRKAIDAGVRYLRSVEHGDGHWEADFTIASSRPGGESCLAMLALLNCGVRPDDPIIQRGLKYQRDNIKPRDTYVVGLQIMVYAAAGDPQDRPRIQQDVDWLLKNRVYAGNEFIGWSYGTGGLKISDNSNTQYALLGLHEAHLAGAKIKREDWLLIRNYYANHQRPDGGWGYAPLAGNGSILTMTSAGLCGLLISGQELRDRREQIDDKTGRATGCGKYAEDRNVAAALQYIGDHFYADPRNSPRARHPYYNLYGLERVGRLTGLRFLGDHDWYREGCNFLVDHQDRNDGHWLGDVGGLDNWKVVCTSFALLFLSKGRTPILVSKLVHEPGNDWNNDHDDARRLTEFSSKELFNKVPLAWQIFETKRGLRNTTQEEIDDTTAQLLQSPIAYFNGHKAPRFLPAEEKVLKKYIEEGGFVLGEACCGKKEFADGFRDLMARLFPDNPLKPLPAEHPIWRSHFLIKPGDFPLEGIEMGCKTVVVFSPKDLSCYWESNHFDKGNSQLAFRLGANIVAYATGMELPKPRLTEHEVARDDGKRPDIRRGYLQVAQLRHTGDWQPAPRAMRNLMVHLEKEAGLLVVPKTAEGNPSQTSILDYKFLYMHGRREFTFGTTALENLRTNLQTGGLLFADACCGKKPFDTSFRAMVQQLFPDKKLEPIPADDPLFGEELNGKAITTVRCRRESADGTPDPEVREVPPFLEGIKLNGRWVVIYSKYDIGCALEKHQSTDCLGHDHESALRIGAAAVLYALRR